MKEELVFHCGPKAFFKRTAHLGVNNDLKSKNIVSHSNHASND